MRPDYVPVTQGSSDSRSLDVDGLRVIEARFPAGARIPPHRHERAILAVMVEGSFDVDLAHATHACPTSAVFTEPLGERHANRIDRRGARVVVIQPDPERAEAWEPCSGLFEAHRQFVNGRIAEVAWRLSRELIVRDSHTRLAAEGLALEMLALAARVAEADASRPNPPRWLARAQDLLHDRFLEDLGIADVAREAGVHPVYLARVFRAQVRVPIGEYLRRLRLEWAARRLARGDEPLCQIALAAGFADQSHFTRAFKAYAGTTPEAYRRQVKG